MAKQKTIYATRDVYFRVCRGADEPRTFETHPVSDIEAASQLHGRGLAVSADMLNNLKRRKDGFIPKSDKPSGHPSWTPEIIEKVADYYGTINPPRLTPLAGFLHDQGLTMDEYLLALEAVNKDCMDAYGMASFGILWKRNSFTPDPTNFELHVLPQRGKAKAKVWFTIRDDVRREIETKAKSK